MTGSTIILEVHAFRRPGIYGGELGRALCIGFVSATYVPMLLTEWLRERIERLKKVGGESRGFVEMACAGEGTDNAENARNVAIVPWNGKPIHK